MYKLHLILKYLLKRRIAWVSLLGVMLCTTMVLVVISVMGGWLTMFKSSFRGLSGDIVIHAETLKGFPYYQQMIDAIVADPKCKVEAAVPTLETAALFNHGSGPIPVRVMGMQVEKIDTVNKFGDSLYLQHTTLTDKLKDKSLTPAEREKLELKLKQPPSLDLLDSISTPLAALPADLKYATPTGGQPPNGAIDMPADFPKQLKGRLRYDAIRHQLLFRGEVPQLWKPLLSQLSNDAEYQQALTALYGQKPFADYFEIGGKFNGIIVGTGVIGIQRNREGVWQRPKDDIEWTTPTHLTVLDLSGDNVNRADGITRNFYIVDDSHIGVWQYDSNYVYVGFDLLQKDLGLDAQPVTIEDLQGVKHDLIRPARCTDIHIKVQSSIDPNDEGQLIGLRDQIQSVVNRVQKDQQAANALLPAETGKVVVETWQDTQRIWINAVENEKLLMVILFGIMCIVAIFLIFCIFYMIVVEKTRDIGIIKSVGATSAGVAGIFLGYGLVIGLLGSGAGLLLSYGIVRYINEIHAFIGKITGVLIWNPQVYIFDKIPDKLDPTDICWVVPTAIMASVLGALVPAVRAARLNPVESLRWE